MALTTGLSRILGAHPGERKDTLNSLSQEMVMELVVYKVQVIFPIENSFLT
jgi:hypothetical protein